MRGCSRGGVHGCSWGGHAWLLPGGTYVVAPGGMHGCSRGGMRGCSQGGMCGCSEGACVVTPRGGVHGCSGGHVWLLWGACMVALGGHGCSWGGHAWDTTRYGDTVNERAVRILLECILVLNLFAFSMEFDGAWGIVVNTGLHGVFTAVPEPGPVLGQWFLLY